MSKVRWSGIPRKQVTYKEFDEIIESLRAKGYKEIEKSLEEEDWLDRENHIGVFSIDKGSLTVFGGKKGQQKQGLKVCYLSPYDSLPSVIWACKETVDEIKVQEIKASKRFHERFTELTGKQMRYVFGVVDSERYQNLVPKPAYYLNEEFTFENVEDVKMIDITSMYPWACSGRMPTVKGMKVVEGRVKPSAEFPFAFYLVSNHVAEYERFDTHDYFDQRKVPSELRDMLVTKLENGKKKLRYEMIEDEAEVTVLMPVASEELTSTFNSFYEEKAAAKKDSIEYNEAKFIMNAAIGTFHKNPKKRGKEQANDYYHIAAIAKGRANQRIIDTFNQIIEAGNIPLQVIVDGIIYIQQFKDSIGIVGKKLGEFNIEAEGAVYRSNGKLNRYVVADKEGKIIKAVVSGYEGAAEKIKALEDIDIYRASEEEQNGGN